MTSPFEPLNIEPIPRTALSPAEAAASVGLCERTLSDLLVTGEIRSIKVGRRRLVPVAELRRWLSDRAAEGGGDNE